MKEMLNKNTAGLAVGSFFAIINAVWSVIVFSGLGLALLNWAISIHLLSNAYYASTLALADAVYLIALSFAGGYVLGWVFAAIWNKFNK